MASRCGFSNIWVVACVISILIFSVIDVFLITAHQRRADVAETQTPKWPLCPVTLTPVPMTPGSIRVRLGHTHVDLGWGKKKHEKMTFLVCDPIAYGACLFERMSFTFFC